MKLNIFSAIFFLFVFVLIGNAQVTQIEPTPAPVKVVVTDSIPALKPSPTPIIVGRINPESVVRPLPLPTPSSYRSLGFRQLKIKIAEAKRSMLSRPTVIASSEGTSVNNELVRIAFHDWKTGEIDYAVMSKEAFLSTADEKQLVSQNGRQLRSRTIRGNGVNTPIILIDENGEAYLPLIVQYPVIRGGKFIETAYYMSTHPGLVTPEIVNAGRYYVRNVIDLARERLHEKGILIQPQIADIAERLAAVEHVDHMRFRTEPHVNIYNDIYTLFALNEGQTYRYSVSSAGAGGMVQMIPSTYRMVRSWHPNVGLMPDFVEGMRNHVNASQAMLLYMQRTWNDLIASPTVADAFSSGIATQEQLMAAGYNSNPARLAGYINRGGEGWTNLIPRETKIYLQIYESIERHVPMTARTR
ncbi:MAG: hypothetical protein ACT4O9_06995 [Blastocatellia bacterium]